MTILVIAGALILLAIAIIAIAWPLLNERDDPSVVELDLEEETGSAVDPLIELEQQRDGIYQAIRELRFDHEVGKVSEADFQVFETQLKGQAVGVLKEIDALEAAESDPDIDAQLEAEITALRHTNGHGPSRVAPVRQPAGSAAFCTQCGTKLRPDDKFCGQCGAVIG